MPVYRRGRKRAGNRTLILLQVHLYRGTGHSLPPGPLRWLDQGAGRGTLRRLACRTHAGQGSEQRRSDRKGGGCRLTGVAPCRARVEAVAAGARLRVGALACIHCRGGVWAPRTDSTKYGWSSASRAVIRRSGSIVSMRATRSKRAECRGSCSACDSDPQGRNTQVSSSTHTTRRCRPGEHAAVTYAVERRLCGVHFLGPPRVHALVVGELAD